MKFCSFIIDNSIRKNVLLLLFDLVGRIEDYSLLKKLGEKKTDGF